MEAVKGMMRRLAADLKRPLARRRRDERQETRRVFEPVRLPERRHRSIRFDRVRARFLVVASRGNADTPTLSDAIAPRGGAEVTFEPTRMDVRIRPSESAKTQPASATKTTPDSE